MKTQDYAQEMGLESSEKKIKWPYALLIIAVLIGATVYGLTRLNDTRPLPDRVPVSTQPAANQ